VVDDRALRRAARLPGAGVLGDGTSFDLTVVDISNTGCRVQTAYALEEGAELTLSIVGIQSSIRATVRWCKSGLAGLLFSKDEEEPQAERTPRREERLALTGNLALRRPGRSSYQARMFDLTPQGCRVEFVERPKAGELMWAKLEGLEPMEASVRWVDGFYGGLEFSRPIHAAVFELLLKRLQK